MNRPLPYHNKMAEKVVEIHNNTPLGDYIDAKELRVRIIGKLNYKEFNKLSNVSLIVEICPTCNPGLEDIRAVNVILEIARYCDQHKS
jgi:hypothetical protein